MVEVLVTLVILSVGLLGVASLQFIGTLSNSDALHRSQAVMVAQQLSERLRANAALSTVGTGLVVDNSYFNATLYNFSNLSCAGNTPDFQCHCLAHPPSIPNCRNNACSAAQFAAFDAYEMSCSAASVSSNFELSLTCTDNNTLDGDTCSAGSRHRIFLKWPVENWQNIERQLNADCNVGESEPHDCVVVDVTL